MTANDKPADLHIFFESRNWAQTHLVDAPKTIVDFLKGDGISLEGKNLLDLGTGDGLIATGLGHLIQSDISGADPLPINWDYYEREKLKLCGKKCDHSFEFIHLGTQESKNRICNYDFVLSWSVVEHVENLNEYFEMANSSLKAGGIMFLQTYPVWESRWGHHLFEWLPPYFHLNNDLKSVMDYLSTINETPAEISIGKFKKTRRVEEILEYRSLSRQDLLGYAEKILKSCNKATIQDIGNALEQSGLVISKVELINSPTHIPIPNGKFIQNSIEGVKLLAYKP